MSPGWRAALAHQSRDVRGLICSRWIMHASAAALVHCMVLLDVLMGRCNGLAWHMLRAAHLIAAEVFLHSSLQHLVELPLCCVVLVLHDRPAAALPVRLCQLPNAELLQDQSGGRQRRDQ